MQKRSRRQIAFLFNEAGDGIAKDLTGGKAESLVTMTRMGLPVPPGFFLTTGVCRAYMQENRFPKRMTSQVERAVAELERMTGKEFGGKENPLLLSVRSGAKTSMPGMMDTILNLGITYDNFEALKKNTGGKQFARNVMKRFSAGYQKVTGSYPDMRDPWQQLLTAFEAVCHSWYTPRAIEYRKVHGLSDFWGTAITAQAMVFGNLDVHSGTGVAFSRNTTTGDNEFYGEYLPLAQGEDVVSGGVQPLPISALADKDPQSYEKLRKWAIDLENRYGDVVDIEFTIEQGKLWLLQARPAKRTPTAAARFAVQFQWEGRITKEKAVARVSDKEVPLLTKPEFDRAALVEAIGSGRLVAKGLPVTHGSVVGNAVFTSADAIVMQKRGERPVLFRPDTTPDDLSGMIASVAVVTQTGGVTCHAAVVCRALGKPAVVGAGEIRDLYSGDKVSVDGRSGTVVRGELPLAGGSHGKEISIFLKWRAALKPAPKRHADFSAVNRDFSANTMLRDFYLTDAIAHATVGTKFEFEAKALRSKVHQEIAGVFAAYLMLASAGELRYGWNEVRDVSDNVVDGFWKAPVFEDLASRFGLRNLSSGDHDRDRSDAQKSVISQLRESSVEQQIEFLRLAVSGFGIHLGASIGGPRWAEIADTARKYLTGEYEPSVFVDHVFDLRHNGGKLFNKHPMFRNRTDESQLQRLLQVKKIADPAEMHKTFWAYRTNEWVTLGVFLSPEVEALWEKFKTTKHATPT